jgi:hypothetical protein
MQSATLDWCAIRLAAAIEQVAMALAEPEIVPVKRSLLGSYDQPASTPSHRCAARRRHQRGPATDASPARRFLQALAEALQGQHEVGDGLLYRTIREIQRRHFDPPQLDHPLRPGVAK